MLQHVHSSTPQTFRDVPLLIGPIIKPQVLYSTEVACQEAAGRSHYEKSKRKAILTNGTHPLQAS